MYWYIINNIPMSLTYNKGKEVVTATMPVNTIFNKIVYDGVSPYTPPLNMRLLQSSNDYAIGDQMNAWDVMNSFKRNQV